MAEDMTTEEVKNVAMSISILIPLIETMDLERYIDTINRGEALVPIIDPTFYKEFGKTGERNKRIAQALLNVQRHIKAVKEETKESGR